MIEFHMAVSSAAISFGCLVPLACIVPLMNIVDRQSDVDSDQGLSGTAVFFDFAAWLAITSRGQKARGFLAAQARRHPR
jgi:hypothetical protein